MFSIHDSASGHQLTSTPGDMSQFRVHSGAQIYSYMLKFTANYMYKKYCTDVSPGHINIWIQQPGIVKKRCWCRLHGTEESYFDHH